MIRFCTIFFAVMGTLFLTACQTTTPEQLPILHLPSQIPPLESSPTTIQTSTEVQWQNAVVAATYWHTQANQALTTAKQPIEEQQPSSTLNPNQIAHFQQGWKHLQQAEQQFRYAGIIIAELRQQWRVLKSPEQYADLEKSIAALPTQAELLEQRKVCQNLQVVYQQTMLKNPELDFPDTWEP